MKGTLLTTKTITSSETAALYWYVFSTNQPTWKEVYLMACGVSEEECPNPEVYTSRWKNLAKTKKELQRIQLFKETMIRETYNHGFEEGKAAAVVEGIDQEQRRAAGIDYTDPVAQKAKLNEIIASAKDSGEALDALKVIISGQKDDKQAAKDNQIQRFYTPLQCKECPLYLAKKK